MKTDTTLMADSNWESKNNNYCFSRLVRNVWGVEPFYFSTLKDVLRKLHPEHLSALAKAYALPIRYIDYGEFTDSHLEEALNSLKNLDEQYEILLITRKKHLKKKTDDVSHTRELIISGIGFNTNWDIKISDLNLSARIKNALRHSSILTINDLVNFGLSRKKFFWIRNLGDKSIDELNSLLQKDFGLKIED